MDEEILDKTIEEINKAIDYLNRSKVELLSIKNNLKLSRDKLEILSIQNTISDFKIDHNITSDTKTLFLLLEQKRKKIAKEKNISVDDVFNDDELKLISQKKPETDDDFYKIIGIRQNKVNKHIKDFLPLIRKYLGLKGPIIIKSTDVNISDKKELSRSEKKLYEALKSIRTRLSKEEKNPAYTIFTNNTLEDIVRYKPKNREELLNIKGISVTRADWFGHEILEEVENFLSNNM